MGAFEIALTVAAIIQGSWVAALAAFLAPLLTAASINGLYRHQTGVKLHWRHAWVGFALLMTAPLERALTGGEGIGFLGHRDAHCCKGPFLFQPRWATSSMRGPMTRT